MRSSSHFRPSVVWLGAAGKFKFNLEPAGFKERRLGFRMI
jgi:hypothetical protein